MGSKYLTPDELIRRAELRKQTSYKKRHRRSVLEKHDIYIVNCLYRNLSNSLILDGIKHKDRRLWRLSPSTLSRYIRKNHANIRQN